MFLKGRMQNEEVLRAVARFFILPFAFFLS